MNWWVGCCTLPGCGAMPGDTVHLLSGQCPALRKFLASSLAHGLNTLGSHPLLLKAAENALMSSPEDWVQFILKPSANPAIIELRQKLGPQSIWPIFWFSWSFVRTMHSRRMKIREESDNLFSPMICTLIFILSVPGVLVTCYGVFLGNKLN